MAIVSNPTGLDLWPCVLQGALPEGFAFEVNGIIEEKNLSERVAQLVSHFGFLLGESALTPKPKKIIHPQSTQTADDVLRNGVVFKHALRPVGVLRERDQAASRLGHVTRKPKGN